MVEFEFSLVQRFGLEDDLNKNAIVDTCLEDNPNLFLHLEGRQPR